MTNSSLVGVCITLQHCRYVDRLLNRHGGVSATITHAPYPRTLTTEDDSMEGDEEEAAVDAEREEEYDE